MLDEFLHCTDEFLYVVLEDTKLVPLFGMNVQATSILRNELGTQ